MARLFLFMGALVLVSGCSSSPFEELPGEPEVCLIGAAETLSLSDESRTEIQLLASYYGMKTSENMSQGTDLSGNELRTILEDGGFTVFSFSGSLRQEATGVLDNLDEGRPLLLLLDADLYGAFWVLVVGYDEDGDYLVIHRPDSTLKALAISRFLPWWQKSEYLTLLAVPNHLMGD